MTAADVQPILPRSSSAKRRCLGRARSASRASVGRRNWKRWKPRDPSAAAAGVRHWTTPETFESCPRPRGSRWIRQPLREQTSPATHNRFRRRLSSRWRRAETGSRRRSVTSLPARLPAVVCGRQVDPVCCCIAVVNQNSRLRQHRRYSVMYQYNN